MAFRFVKECGTWCARNSFRRLSQKAKIPDHQIVVSDDGSTVVFWHPDKPFPYEHSLPIPERKVLSNTSLKIQNVSAVRSVFKPKSSETTRQELMQLTHTSKHTWFPRSRDKKRKNTPMNRPYL